MTTLRVWSYKTTRGETLPLLIAAETADDALDALRAYWGYAPWGSVNPIERLWYHGQLPEVIPL